MNHKTFVRVILTNSGVISNISMNRWAISTKTFSNINYVLESKKPSYPHACERIVRCKSGEIYLLLWTAFFTLSP